MIEKLKARLLSLRDLLATAWWIVLIVGIGFVVAFQFVEPAPPRHLVISTGSEAGAYYQFAKRYAAILARDGITLEIRTSAGSLENIENLKNNQAQVAFVQGGVLPPRENPDEEDDSGLLSLGSVFYEPVWVFHRGPALQRLADLKGKRIAIGQEGSGIRALAQTLLGANDVPMDGNIVSLSGLEAAEALQQGKIDAAFIIASESAPVVQVLVRSPGVRLMNFSQSWAYERRYPFLTRLTLPRGVADFVRDLPPEDIRVLAPTANLIVRDDLHPALQTLLLQAAREVHGKPGFFQSANEFPAYMDAMLPLSSEAERFFRSGPPFLQRYLPFWLAVLADRLIVLLVPVIALLIPLLKLAPAVYSWRVRSKVFRCYGELKFLEEELRHHFDVAQQENYRARLDALEDEAQQLRVPLGFSDLVYTLREHVNLVRQTLNKLEKTA